MNTRNIKITRGLDIPLQGAPTGGAPRKVDSAAYGIAPDDFPGHVWKPDVHVGDHVDAGAPLLHAKEHPEMRLVSPVAGKVTEIRRGERRRILYVVVEPDGSDDAIVFPCGDALRDASALLAVLAESGLMAMMRQRPFDTVPAPDVSPRDIFVTGFDSAPLAPELISGDDLADLEQGLAALGRLTSGKVYLSLRPDSPLEPKGAEIVRIEGPHPAGNVGVMIGKIAPVNKGETVWTLDARTACRIGRLVSTGKPDLSARVAVTGPEAQSPCYAETFMGCAMSALLVGEIDPSRAADVRVISGNVLTGVKVNPADEFLRFPYRQVTLIEEGHGKEEFMGWASVSPNRYSVKKFFPAWLRGLKKPFDFDARLKGGHRAMILSGEYDKVFPFDIYPEYLLKAIMARDIEKMEQLGIYEVAPEDFALPEFVDTSKIELQKIVREGLDYLRSEI